ncbi:xylulokinase [Tuwongella immobilis]|uniref:Xylulokinase n=1 Tax=Tuwongella immobilis TaxID=692036 RepID=A0A6C2YIS9_9BACT|nr:FGGY-family carbohydrate kinase [Tuwongella immobilis]VIP00882.1 xylulokinase : Xylulokinase OS=Clostridium cellulovorans (strain ATCC 35296 / DSM 3052 / OCM 3 / 743B) GN=Clocel_0592 PE=3 SV=1: FGGY_N: FGGY_C [Tuwongella immobilis]VTR97182.1 xylulokinase : Xylulokinase OS=Clostridium cellulovorans (strain ATCC 35296 / DSM 3052 / OCM 3 / 743B) GN=Clocel_0592 PE=3 SV=1: FGGY_N: FGGY_C [Tuwongella immobilis]
MAASLRTLDPNSLIVGWDFSTGSVKALAFDLAGQVVAEARYPTDLWTAGGVAELSLMQLEGQARATTRAIAAQLRQLGRLSHWVAGGISATHHTAGRVDAAGNPLRRAICWNDQTLLEYHARGEARLGAGKAQELTGGPWAVRYSLSHLVKDEATLSPDDWRRTVKMLPHGPLAAGYLTGRMDVTSRSSAASTGILDLRTNQWRREMLDCLESAEYRELAWNQLPTVVDAMEPIGPLTESVALDAGIPIHQRPLIFPTLDDQAAGLVGGGAVDAGQVAVILGNSAVVNSSSSSLPKPGTLDAMATNWGPYLWMRCYSNGAQFLDPIVGRNPDWAGLESAARAVPAGCDGVGVLPFALAEPSLGVMGSRVEWLPSEPTSAGVRFRAALEAIAYLIAMGVEEHEAAGQNIREISISGGITRNALMCEILATVLDRPLKRLVSNEGTALGAAVTALAAMETHGRKQAGIAEPFTVADAVSVMVQFREPVQPIAAEREAYRHGLARFKAALQAR